MASVGASLFTQAAADQDYPLVYKPGDDTNMVFTVEDDKGLDVYPKDSPVAGYLVKVDVYYV